MKIRTPVDWAETLLAHYRSDPELADRVASERWPALLTHANVKLVKGKKIGFLTAGLQLSPADESGVNLCPASTKACREACLGHSAGRMQFTESKRARVLRSIFLLTRFEQFKAQLDKELEALARKAKREGLLPACRPNTTSDLPWERLYPEMFDKHNVAFYDYTKDRRRMKAFLAGDLPGNYYLTFSRTARNWPFCDYVLQCKGTVAVVFHPTLPTRFNGYPVLNGDLSDVRVKDMAGHVIGLHAKGKATKDSTGFVVHYP